MAAGNEIRGQGQKGEPIDLGALFHEKLRNASLIARLTVRSSDQAFCDAIASQVLLEERTQFPVESSNLILRFLRYILACSHVGEIFQARDAFVERRMESLGYPEPEYPRSVGIERHEPQPLVLAFRHGHLQNMVEVGYKLQEIFLVDRAIRTGKIPRANSG